MSWPTDPEARAVALERHRQACARRWTDAARAEVGEKSRAQFADPAARARMAESKRALYAARPELKQQIAEKLKARCRAKAARLQLIRARCIDFYARR